jgi:hypothetical protein
MMRLPDSLAAWGTTEFRAAFKREAEQLDAALLPLQQGLSYSSVVADSPFSVVLIGAEEEARHIRVRAGIFYSGIIAGCSCADDPTPVDALTEYCEALFVISKANAETRVGLIADESPP